MQLITDVLGTAEEQEDCTITFLIKMNLCNWELITANFALVVARQFYQGAIYESLVLGLLASLSQQICMHFSPEYPFSGMDVSAHYIHENIHIVIYSVLGLLASCMILSLCFFISSVRINYMLKFRFFLTGFSWQGMYIML
ncbi:hypothetical protein ACJX0J_025810 [Zea mays]